MHTYDWESIFELVGKIIVYGGGGLLAIAIIFFAFIGFMFLISWSE